MKIFHNVINKTAIATRIKKYKKCNFHKKIKNYFQCREFIFIYKALIALHIKSLWTMILYSIVTILLMYRKKKLYYIAFFTLQFQKMFILLSNDEMISEADIYLIDVNFFKKIYLLERLVSIIIFGNQNIDINDIPHWKQKLLERNKRRISRLPYYNIVNTKLQSRFAKKIICYSLSFITVSDIY